MSGIVQATGSSATNINFCTKAGLARTQKNGDSRGIFDGRAAAALSGLMTSGPDRFNRAVGREDLPDPSPELFECLAVGLVKQAPG
jgi:hypothetical protein